MLTKNIKYPYVKFGFDVVGVLASIGIFLIFFFNAHANFGSDGSSSFGINIAGSSMVLLYILILIVVICAIVSLVLKLIKEKH
ncbi:hypothetical protein [Staphylococcus aureus]|uniref:hypothetical protein n=1 Tax=Staphylococcus aureus TaxID=1280 RepID=UPI0018EA2A52|nr:hypothetical protein [Staphylococcus aureus]MBJ6154040.1 hypothetical protein [Staphylococcus aureus]MBJ6156746.1 hypothetical protein [Staphylococcus aureus]MBJ6164788.1 hypothetical protein [Staphylococcus aureus]MBJ6166567.1 hypothetical protein [Staphylococcus aureus]MBJ6169692.1 hypothetical protein [Staphylococcus aureus]